MPQHTTQNTTQKMNLAELVFVVVMGVLFGGITWLYAFFYSVVNTPLSPLGLDYFFGAFWLLPGVFLGYMIQKPGAALLGAFMASVPGLFGSWGVASLYYGAAQGLGAEVALLLSFYVFSRQRAFSWGYLIPAGVLSSAASYTLTFYLYGYESFLENQRWLIASQIVSGLLGALVLVSFLSYALGKSLGRTGLLDRFAVIKSNMKKK